LDNVSHDVVSNFLKRSRITAQQVWELVKELIKNTPDSFLIIDDSVQDKRYSKSIDMVKKQYSGAVGSLVRGIGVVNLVLSFGKEHYPIDYRIYDNDADGKTKNDHFRDMLINAVADKGIQAKIVLFYWYASWENLKLVHSLKLTLKSQGHRLEKIRLSGEGQFVFRLFEGRTARSQNQGLFWMIAKVLSSLYIRTCQDNRPPLPDRNYWTK
jgi:hypothetical protein